MQIRTNANDAENAEAIRSYIERRLRLALGRFGQRVGHITVRISPDGPSANHCRIRAEMVPLGQIIVEETDSDLFTAVDRAAGNIRRQFGRELERIRNSRVGRESVRLGG